MRYVRFLHQNKPYYGQLEENNVLPLSGSPFHTVSVQGAAISLKDVRFLPPCEPSKIVAVGLNYADHAKEMHLAVPDFPALFLKPSTSVIGPDDGICYPSMSAQVDYEAELAVVIGKKAHRVKQETAKDYIFGYTCLNDVTARDLQHMDSQWTRAKGFDTFAPVGPWIETDVQPDELDICARLNGKIVQKSNTKNLIFKVDYLLSVISQIMTLYPGDIITTGTSSGIGPMKVGDTVEVEIEGIGILKNTVQGDESDD